MKIYFNGCSHSRGTHLSLPDIRKSFPFLLSNSLLPEDWKFEPKSSGSNERIYRRTIEFFARNNFDLAVIQWTDVARFETPIFSDYSFHKSMNDEGWLQHNPVSSIWDSRKDMDIPWRNYYKDNYQKILERDNIHVSRLHNKTLAQIMGLSGFLKSIGVRSIHLPYDGLRGADHKLRELAVENVEFLIHPSNGLQNTLFQYGFDICRKSDNPGSGEVDGHFMEDAHEQISEWLFLYINGDLKMIGKEDSQKVYDPIATIYE